MSDRISSLPLPSDGGRRAPDRTRRRVAIATIVLIVAAGALVAWYKFGVARGAPDTAQAPQAPFAAVVTTDSLSRAPEGVRIRVRVINATDVRGLARKATLMLRDLGYDVVDFDGDAKLHRERTVVISHTNHPDWAQHMQRAIGATAIETSADSAHYVDLTVLLGSDWKAPTQPFRP